MIKNRVLVIGDIMLDRYISGNVNRISPEAPVPVLNVTNESIVLGGAANVANNISSLKAEVTLIGVIGNDIFGEQIKSLLDESKIKHHLYMNNELSTIVKQRIIGNEQQIIRMDYNDSMIIKESVVKSIIKDSCEMLQYHDIVVLSDYNKGMLNEEVCLEIIKCCNKMHKTIIVDPKGNDWSKYKNANVITPNFMEIKRYLGVEFGNTDEDIEKYTLNICGDLGIDNLLITRSEKGMSLLTNKYKMKTFDTLARDVYDVSGAGDTVVGVLATFYSKDDLDEVVKLANYAAGVVVGKKGTTAINIDDLKDYNSNLNTEEVCGKISTIFDIEKKLCGFHKIVFTNGCFDILHRGHIHYLKEAAKLGDCLIIGLNSDSSIRSLKGESRPVNNQNDRAYILSQLPFINFIVIFDELSPENILSSIRPDILVKGGDYDAESVLGRQYAKEVKILSFLEGYSSSNIIKRSGD